MRKGLANAWAADGSLLARLGLESNIREGEDSVGVVLLGPDPKEELGALYLRLRHAVTRNATWSGCSD